MKRFIVLTCLVILFAAGCSPIKDGGTLPDDVFHKAVRAYETKEYDKAITLYEGLRARDLENGSLYYNLGNAYLKKGEVGKAVVNYARARYYIPRDSELIANNNCAFTRMRQQDPAARLSSITRELIRFFSIFTMKEEVYIFFVIYYLLTGLIIYIMLVKRRRIFAIMAAFITALLLGLTVLPVFHKICEAQNAAVIINPVIDARKEPYDDGPVIFPLYGGMKVYIMKERVGWSKVQRPDGRIGWVPSSVMEKIWR